MLPMQVVTGAKSEQNGRLAARKVSGGIADARGVGCIVYLHGALCKLRVTTPIILPLQYARIIQKLGFEASFKVCACARQVDISPLCDFHLLIAT